MAFWGAPIDDDEHRSHAILAAREMLDQVEALKPEFREQGFPEVNVGIGINTGVMNVGDAVNLGSRLESLTKFYGIKLLSRGRYGQ